MKCKDNRSNIIKGRAQMKGLGVQELAKRVGIPVSTMYRKLKFPGGLRLEELSIIDEVVGFSEEEVLYFIRWRRCGR